MFTLPCMTACFFKISGMFIPLEQTVVFFFNSMWKEDTPERGALLTTNKTK